MTGAAGSPCTLSRFLVNLSIVISAATAAGSTFNFVDFSFVVSAGTAGVIVVFIIVGLHGEAE